MTSTDVDWDEAERHGRRTDLLAAPLFGLLFASMVLLNGGEFAFVGGTAAWLVAAVPVLVVLLIIALQQTVTSMRARAAAGHRLQYALREHVDPGPQLRTRLDVHARYLASVSWSVWVFPLPVVVLLLAARWDRPATTVPAAAVLLVLTIAFAIYWRRMILAAQRWVADPPGPPREVPPPGRAERWTTGLRPLIVIAGIVGVTAFAAGLVIGLVD